MEKPKRQRTGNFTEEDKIKLVGLIQKYQRKLHNKETDSVTNQEKEKYWSLLADEFNSSSLYKRSVLSLKKLWDNLKRDTKQRKANASVELFKTGGGPATVMKTNPVFEVVEALLGTAATGVPNIYISGISILGIPAEMYTYGTQFWMIICSEGLVSVTMAVAYLPVFYKLQITSSYEYLNLRFNQTVRLLGSILFLTKMLLYIPIVIYVPALAFSQVTGINLHLVTPVVCVVCIFYTTLGGLKAVVWTDTVQTVVMFGALIAVMIMGTISVGGWQEVWSRSQEGGRIDFFNLDWDPTIRHSFWTVSIGNYFSWLASCSINQAMVQRCLAMPSLHSARITVLILVIGIMALVSMCCYLGLILFASYYKCDPVTRGSIVKSDQLLPYFVMQIATVMPGLPGLFVSGVFSAALSSMSTGLNSMTGVIFEDLIKPRMKQPLTEAQASFLMKVIVVIIGSICVALVFVVEKMGALIQASGSMGAITAGPLLGIFTLGMFFPCANSIGALVGGIFSGSLVAWISIGTQLKTAQGIIKFPQKPVSIEDCSSDWIAEYLSLSHSSDTTSTPIEPPFLMYQLSYMYYTALGTITALVVGLGVSYCTGGNKTNKINPDLLSPVIHRFLKKSMNSPEDKNNCDNGVISVQLDAVKYK